MAEREERPHRVALRPGGRLLRVSAEGMFWGHVFAAVVTGVMLCDLLLGAAIVASGVVGGLASGIFLVLVAERRELEVAPGRIGGWRLGAEDALHLVQRGGEIILYGHCLGWAIRRWPATRLDEARRLAHRVASLAGCPLVDTCDRPFGTSALHAARDVAERLQRVQAATSAFRGVRHLPPEQLVLADPHELRLAFRDPPALFDVVLGRHAVTNGACTWLLEELEGVTVYLQPGDTELVSVHLLLVDARGTRPLYTWSVSANLRSLERRRRIGEMLWMQAALLRARDHRRAGRPTEDALALQRLRRGG